MSFLSGIASFGKSAVGYLSGDSFGANLVKTIGLGYAVNRLSTNAIKSNNSGTRNIDQGVRLQIAPDSDSKIPVLYGSAYFGGNIIDARMTNNNKTMWYALALSEKTGTKLSDSTATSYVFDDVYWDNQRIVFQSDGVTVDSTVDTNGTIDPSKRGLIEIYLYAGNSTSGQVPDGYTGTVPNAYDIFPNWTASTHAADDLVFALVKVNYSREKNVTGIGDMLFQVSSDMILPGDVVYDYMTSSRYGVGIDTSEIDTPSLTSLNTYSQSTVDYNDEGTGPQTLPYRYQVNGLVDTSENVLANAENLCNASASWLTYDTQEGLWGVVVNRAGTSVASFNDDNILSTVSVGGTGLTDLYNSVKVEFPHRDLRDSADFVKIEIPSADRNANEPDNTLVITYDNINEPVQAELLGFIELKQSRVDLVVEFEVDYSYLGLKAGDIVDLTNSRLNFSSKLFRIITVSESQSDEGISLNITALEYDADVYSVVDITRFTRSNEDGIITIGSIGQPSIPQVTKFETDSRPRVRLESDAPTGVVEAMEFWLSNDVNVAESNRSYRLLTTVRPTSADTFVSGTTVDTEVDSIAASEFVIKSRGVNSVTTGPYSDPSVTVVYDPTQTTDAITPDTQALDDTGALATALGVLTLLNNLDDIYQGVTGNDSLFDTIFDLFETETGTNLLDYFTDTANTFSLTSSDSVINEGSSFTVTLAVGGLSDGSVVPYTITGVDSNDINGTSLNGDFIVQGNQATKTFVVSEDGVTEGVETFTLTLDNVSPAVSISIPIVEGEITYSLSSSSLNVTEGQDFIITLTTTNVPDGTVVPYTITGVESTDINNAPLTGTFTISSDSDTQFFTSTVDVDDFDESFVLSLDQTGDSITVGILEPDLLNLYDLLPADRRTQGPPLEENSPNLVPITGSYYFRLNGGQLFGDLTIGSGDVKLYKSDGTLVEAVPASSLVIDGNVVEIPFADRELGTDYYILVDEGVVNYCSRSNEAIETPTFWNFNTPLYSVPPYSKPTVTLAVGAVTFPIVTGNQNNVCPSGYEFVLSFSDFVSVATGTIVIEELDAGVPVSTVASIDASTGVPSFNTISYGSLSLDYDKDYRVTVPQGVATAETGDACYSGTKDSASKVFNISTTIQLALQATDPVTVESSPFLVEGILKANPQTNVNLNFNKPISFGDSGTITIFEENGTIHQVFDINTSFENNKTSELLWITGNTVVLNPTQDFKLDTNYYINADEGVVVDGCGDLSPVITGTSVAFNIDTGPLPSNVIAPSGSISSSNVEFEMDREVTPGAGNIKVVDENGTVVKTISANDPAVTYTEIPEV